MDDETLDCKNCETPMEITTEVCYERIRPTTIYQCPDCLRRLYLFDGQPKALRLSSSTLHGVIHIADFVERKAREKGIALSPQPALQLKNWPSTQHA